MKYKQALKLYVFLLLFSLIFYLTVLHIYGLLPNAGAALLGVMISIHAFFLIGVIKKNHTVIDTAWGLSFIIVAHVTFWMQPAHGIAQWITLALVTIWGLRLFLHILSRTVGKEEDPRYRQMREQLQMKKHALLMSYVRIYLVQGVLAWIIAAPIVFIHSMDQTGVFPLWQVGVALWIIGFLFEVVADQQLKSFLAKSENRGRIMTGGLWKYSRHPNYFGEATQWWGIYLIAAGFEGGWVTFFGPMLITFLLLYVSGVPLAEKLISGFPGFEEYKNRTSMFVPWLPRKGK